jgi:curli biogenesis system outer membrane secretion channel CsgG
MKYLFASGLLALTLFGCDKLGGNGQNNVPTPASVPAPTTVSAPAPATAPAAGSNLPDVGKVEQVKVSSTGSGITPGAAINDALKIAVMQVNGTRVDAASANLDMVAHATAQVDVQSVQGTDSATATAAVQGQGFANMIVTESHGLISSFKVVKLTPPASQGGPYSVDIEAQIAKFKAPADAGKIKVVIAPMYTNRQSFNIGGRAVPAQDVLNVLHQQLVDALTQTGRFTVLDRQFDGEIQNELDMINSGQTNSNDIAKLGQALSADLVWVGVVNDFSYERHARQLQTSSRELVSYSGGWSMSQRMINLTTRQIFQSGTLQGTAPSIEPTTLGTGFDANSTVKGMEADAVKKTVEAILLRTFPVTIVERDGDNVVLSQGGSALAVGNRYAVYLQGKELKDPQTGQSLGLMESPCCDVVVNRVTPNISYGVLENVKQKLDGVAPGSLVLHEALAAKPAAVADAKSGGVAKRVKNDDDAPLPAPKKTEGPTNKDW